MKSPALAFAFGAAFLSALTAAAADTPGDAAKGKVLFQQSCALCHAATLGPGGQPVSGQGPSLVGVLGRAAASLPNFNYSRALHDSGLTWDYAALDHFLEAPSADVPGTTMPIPVPNADTRHDIIAFLSTLVARASLYPREVMPPDNAGDPADWRHDSPGTKHSIDLASLPAPYATSSAGNGPKVVDRPGDATLSVLPGFTVKPFLTGLSTPRLVRIAPNGDIFIAETKNGRVRVLRAADGAEAPSANEVFAEGLSGPFGIAFYPNNGNPQWVYVAEMDSVIRFPYQSGDMKARGPAQVIIPVLAPHNTGGHSTRDVAFSNNGRRMFISVGSGSNIAEDMSTKTPEEVRAWEAGHGRGAAWDGETNRANILVSDPEGTVPLHTYATGIRNGVGLAVNPDTGDLWVSTNERDALGDNLVPDYVTRVKEGGFYGWPWYYMGNHEDPRHAGERPDLAGVALLPDVPEQSHSASLEMTFYTVKAGASAFPAEYLGDAFVALHGSWNRTSRTGYKVARIRVRDGVPTGEYDDFLTGFVVDNHSVWGRPVGVAVARDGALLVTDDGGGVVWRVSHAAAP